MRSARIGGDHENRRHRYRRHGRAYRPQSAKGRDVRQCVLPHARYAPCARGERDHRSDSAMQAMEASDMTILLVPSGQEVDQVLERDASGCIPFSLSGKTIILMATVAPCYSQALANAVIAAGGRYIEAPVSGSRKPAETGQLVILAAAPHEAWIAAA